MIKIIDKFKIGQEEAKEEIIKKRGEEEKERKWQIKINGSSQEGERIKSERWDQNLSFFFQCFVLFVCWLDCISRKTKNEKENDER